MIIPDQIVIFDEIPNNSIAKPAVTMVTAACIVKIVTIDKEAKRISLSYRETLDNPWSKISDSIGQVLEVKIKRFEKIKSFFEKSYDVNQKETLH